MNYITILWMLYLAVLLYFTLAIVVNNVSIAIGGRKAKSDDFIIEFTVCLMWAIWYMFYLH